MPHRRPKLSFLRIVEMNVGFFGLQFSFGLQQANMAPIYGFLGADAAELPLLWLAGPMTGLIVQPLVGARSDRTLGRWGQRTPYFLIGAILCSLALVAMPGSATLWMAASLLWILDSGNNMVLEPYRAYVADRLELSQQPLGFMVQSAFTGLAQTLSYLAPSLLTSVIDRNLLGANGIPEVVRAAFIIGAVLSISTIVYSLWRVPELALEADERAVILARPRRRLGVLRDIGEAVAAMPPAMWRLAAAMLFQWYAMFAYWQYVAFALARSLHGTADPSSAAFREATLTAQQFGALYNAVAFVAALALIPVERRVGAWRVQAACLTASGLAMVCIPAAQDLLTLAVLMIGVGLGWAGMMGNNYIILAAQVPAGRNGIYMGIFNMFIVIPMLIEVATMPLIFGPVLGGDPRQVIVLCGVLMMIGATVTLGIGRVMTPSRAGDASRQ